MAAVIYPIDQLFLNQSMAKLIHHCKNMRFLVFHTMQTQEVAKLTELIASVRDRIWPLTYERWIRRYDTLTERGRSELLADCAQWKVRPLISILMAIESLQPNEFVRAIHSLLRQIYSNWELCIFVDETLSEQVKRILLEESGDDYRISLRTYEKLGLNSWNQTLTFAAGEYLALMAADAELSEQALYWVVKEIIADPELDLIFSDEDKNDGENKRYEPWFKPDWNQSLMQSQNAFGNLGVYRRHLVEKAGGFRANFGVNEDYDLVLRCANESSAVRIRHIPRVLYHGGGYKSTPPDDEKWETGRQAIQAQLNRTHINAIVKRACESSYQLQ